jgi:CarD family transcriptional regulator
MPAKPALKSAKASKAVKTAPKSAKPAKKPAKPAKKPARQAAATKATAKPAVKQAKQAAPKAAKPAAKKAVQPAKPAANQGGQPHGARTTPMPSTAKPTAKPAPAAAAAEPAAAKKPTSNKHGFKTGEYIVYPAHGVGQIVSIEEQEIAGYKLELFVITFAKDKMTLRVPVSKIASVGMRKLSAGDVMGKALDTLKGRARVKRTMWSRRAQEYEAKINSGDLVAIAEVVRDLHRADTQPEQSYSERQLYEAALDRMARELAAVEKLTDSEAIKKIEAMLAKGPKRGPRGADEAEAEAA